MYAGLFSGIIAKVLRSFFLLRQPLQSINECLVFLSFKLSQFSDENISKNSTFCAGCFLPKDCIGFVISRKCLNLQYGTWKLSVWKTLWNDSYCHSNISLVCCFIRLPLRFFYLFIFFWGGEGVGGGSCCKSFIIRYN